MLHLLNKLTKAAMALIYTARDGVVSLLYLSEAGINLNRCDKIGWARYFCFVLKTPSRNS